MKILNVRCCCQPQKILGTLEVPDAVASGGLMRVPVQGGIESVEIRQMQLCKISAAVRKYARIQLPPEAEYAVYSEDRPLEFWRKVPGFIEGSSIPPEHDRRC